MAAIITSKFRLDTTNKFVGSLSDNQFYMALGRPNAWTPSDAVPDTPYENDYASNTLWENMFAMKRVDAADIIHSSPRNLWVSGTTYAEYDDQDTNIESKVYFVITTNNNVYMCLKAGTGASSVDPDVIGVQVSGVHVTGADGYIWKYMFTLTSTLATKFLTSSFIPVKHIKENPGSGDLALANQWSVQQAAVDGAIYNMKITTAGTGYTSAPTLTIAGDGASAAATATVSGGAITGITMTNVGTGYTHATVTVTGGGGSNGAIRPVIGPQGGFGADPTNDLRSHYVTVNSIFTGDESGAIPDANDFRQIALCKNPIKSGATASVTVTAANSMVVGQFYKILTMGTTTDTLWETAGTSANPVVGEVFKAIAATVTGSTTGTIAGIAEGSAYNPAKSLAVANTTTFAVDAVIESITGAGAVVAKAMVVEHVGGVLHYIQNEVTGFGTFNASNNIRLEGTSGSGVDVTAVTAPLINHHSGDVMFIENRTSTTRDTGQIETVRLVIAF